MCSPKLVIIEGKPSAAACMMHTSVATVPDICKTPVMMMPIPIPYPNFGLCSTALPPTCGMTVALCGCRPLLLNSIIPSVAGDEAGIMGGVVSQTFRFNARVVVGCFTVMIEGKPAATKFTSLLTSNNCNTMASIV